MASEEGASANERLLAAAKADNEGLAEEVLQEEDCDVNFQDGLGNTALHYAVQYGSTEVLDVLLNIEGCELDIQNRLTKSTPLHLAVKISDLDTRHYIVQSLLEAGAETKIRNKHGQLAQDLVPEDDSDCKKFIRDAEAERAQAGDVASDSDDADGAHSDDVASD